MIGVWRSGSGIGVRIDQSDLRANTSKSPVEKEGSDGDKGIQHVRAISYNSDEALCGWRGTELGWGSCGARLLVSSRYSVAHTVEHCVDKEMPTLWSILFNSDDCHMIKSQHVLSSLTLWFGF